MTDQNSLQSASDFKPRKPWLAGLLSFLFTGLGQVYNGQWKKGVGFFVAEWVYSLAMIPFWSDFVSTLLCLAILLGFNIFVAGEAFASARILREYTPGTWNRWWVYALCLCVSLASGFAFEPLMSQSYETYKAPSASMLPTLKIGDHFMVETLAADDAVQRRDVVIFLFPKDESKYFVKRVIGLPGETVEIRQRQVFVNGQPLEEPYVQHTKMTMEPLRDNFGPLTLGADDYFVLGDNRDESYDSRWWGIVKRQKITAKAKYIYFPGGFESDEWSDRFGMVIR
nr:signal peptidase I [uncultured Pseudodesulfovibrio sp.]